MMLRIHGSPRSRAIRTLWMVAELGLDYEHNPVLPRSPETRSAVFLALNPTGQVPVIEDDGFVLAESMAINLYLAKKHGSPLYPSDPRNEALAWQWSFWETDRLDRQLVTYANHSLVLPDAERDPAIAKAAWKDVGPAFDVLEIALSRTSWLAGPDFSVADLNVAAALYRGLIMDLAKWPHMKTWLHACWDRPAARHARAMRE
jgi:glutathione S-transferase